MGRKSKKIDLTEAARIALEEGFKTSKSKPFNNYNSQSQYLFYIKLVYF